MDKSKQVLNFTSIHSNPFIDVLVGETWVDVSSSDANPDFTRLSGHFAAVAPKSTIAKAGKEVHFMSETGALDVFLFPGPLTHVVSSQYARVVGTPALPPIFAIGYHQCRWNYKDELDVFTVDKEMDSAGFPFDVIWQVMLNYLIF
jgi:alpha 1,3-glucosidase